jgi:hypothetical protein
MFLLTFLLRKLIVEIIFVLTACYENYQYKPMILLAVF